ncbi:MAG: bifunctional riboflavin kinase/FAD synthetase [Clostridia bacterium]
MQVIFSGANDYLDTSMGTGIALGNFDGLHIGHMELINKTVDICKKDHLKSVIYTFNHHPQNIIADKLIISLITPNEIKAEILSRCHVDCLYLDDFNKAFMKMMPEDFIKNILLDRLNAKRVTVGFHYRFGYKNTGDVDVLRKMGQLYGFQVEVVEPVKIGDTVVSSSLIRKLIQKGDVETASKFMNRKYMITGKVVVGKRLGHKLGFPTINIIPRVDIVLPSKGVYITNTILEEKIYASVTNVGANPTVNGQEMRIETHILDFSGILYNHNVNIEFIKKIRDEKKFQGIDELAVQIGKDVKYVKQFFHDQGIYNKINMC